MKRLTNLFVVALLMLSFSVLTSSCKKDDAKYFVSFVFTGEIENVTFNAIISELDNKGKVLNSYECNNVTSGYQTKTYTAHNDAVKVQTDVSFVVNHPVYGEIKGENGWSFTHALTENATTDITVSIKDIKISIDINENVKAATLIK